jgi:hypothetical protein
LPLKTGVILYYSWNKRTVTDPCSYSLRWNWLHLSSPDSLHICRLYLLLNRDWKESESNEWVWGELEPIMTTAIVRWPLPVQYIFSTIPSFGKLINWKY